MASPKTLLVRSQVVTTIVNTMLRSWAAKTTAAQGAKQMVRDAVEGEIASYAFDKWDGVIPGWESGDADSKEEMSRQGLFAGVMTLEAAFEVVDNAALDCQARFEAEKKNRDAVLKVRHQNRYLVKANLRWRSWVSPKIAKQVIAKERLMARVALEASVLRKAPRVGRQRISTTRSRKVPDAGLLVFSGRTAIRMPQGRPALPADVWMSRYLARKSRRQARDKIKFRRNRALPMPPTTKFERPKSIPVLAP